MRTRLIIVALVVFTLGAAVDRVARVTSYDTVIVTMRRTTDTQARLIAEYEQQQAEIDAVLWGDQ
jgi:hypothetical protein